MALDAKTSCKDNIRLSRRCRCLGICPTAWCRSRNSLVKNKDDDDVGIVSPVSAVIVVKTTVDPALATAEARACWAIKPVRKVCFGPETVDEKCRVVVKTNALVDAGKWRKARRQHGRDSKDDIMEMQRVLICVCRRCAKQGGVYGMVNLVDEKQLWRKGGWGRRDKAKIGRGCEGKAGRRTGALKTLRKTRT